MKALYRKYRPTTLSEVVGQEQVTKVLKNAIEQGKPSHAYIFIGPRGTGKTSVARIFAHEINKFKYELEDDYVDIIEIDGASNRGIDNIRELREKAIVAPTTGQYKIYIIDEVHMLTKEAFNALLKTLEEPPAHVIFIMATTDAYKIPVTITSRAQTFTFQLADADTMFKHLKSIAEKEKINITDDALKIVVKRGGGSFRDSLSLLDQISTLSDQEINKDLVISAMGLPEDEKISQLLDIYLSQDVVKITTIFRELLSTGTKAATLAEEIIIHILDDPKPEYLDLLSRLVDIKDPFAEAKLLIALTMNADQKNITLTSENTTSSSKNITLSSKNTTLSQKNTTSLEPTAPAALEPTTEPTPTAPAAPESVPAPAPTPATQDSLDQILQKVKTTSSVIYSQLKNCKCILTNNILDIYPRTKINHSILSSANNKRLLITTVGPNVKITIHEPGEAPKNLKNDPTLSQISGIMEGEVIDDYEGIDPFK